MASANPHNVLIRANTSLVEGETIYYGSYVTRKLLNFFNLGENAVFDGARYTAGDFNNFVCHLCELFEDWAGRGSFLASFAGLQFKPVIRGSFPTIDAAWDSNENEIILDVSVGQAIRECLYTVTPTIVESDDEVLTKLFRFMDITTETPNTLLGRHEAMLFGSNMYFGLTGECAYFEGSNGVTYPLTVVSSESPQRAKVKLTAVPPKGLAGKLVIKSFGISRDTSAPLQTSIVSATYVPTADVLPVINSIPDATAGSDTVTPTGANLLNPDGTAIDSVTVKINGTQVNPMAVAGAENGSAVSIALTSALASGDTVYVELPTSPVVSKTVTVA